MMNRFLFTILLLTSLALLSACSGKSANGESGPARMREAVPVTIAPVVQKTVPVQVRAIGNVQAYSTVSVKSQVSGELIRVYLKEGQYVKAGEPLFTVDPRPFEVALKQAEANLAMNVARLKQAEANLAKDIALLENARVEANRYAELLKKEVVSREEYDQRRTTAESLEAAVQADRAAVQSAQETIQADKAAIENAKIQLGYTAIRSPINGRTGNLIVHEGNIVKANDDPALVVINQVSPIYVAFSVPEQYLGEIKKYMALGKLPVEAVIPGSEAHSIGGELSFVDNTVDQATGTIQLKAIYPNKDNALWPGQFVNTVLTFTTQPNAIVVPSQAIQTGQQGQYVFVVKSDLTVETRPVVVGRTLDGETVIEKGLQPGERVVTDGQLQLVPGAKVEIKSGLQS
jgi:multidrug efflux system membrane fusion protein